MVQAIKSLTELTRYGGSVQATCRACGRVALFAPSDLAMFFRARQWDDSWPAFAKRLRCSDVECGAKNPRVAWIPNNPPTNDPQPPRPRLVRPAPPPPMGVDPD